MYICKFTKRGPSVGFEIAIERDQRHYQCRYKTEKKWRVGYSESLWDVVPVETYDGSTTLEYRGVTRQVYSFRFWIGYLHIDVTFVTPFKVEDDG